MNQPRVNTLTWDSEFFGYPVGILEYSGDEASFIPVLENAKQAGFKLIYLTSQTEVYFTPGLNLLCSVGVADKKIILLKSLEPLPYNWVPAANISRYTSPMVSPVLTQLALISGVYSRFARDPFFKHQEYEKLYTTWIKKSVTGEMADEVWISTTPSGEPNGLITLKKKNEEAVIGLLAVSPQVQRQGNGKNLLQTACFRAAQWGCSIIRVATQEDNLPANNIYQQAGFTLHQRLFMYHLWL